MINAGMTTGSDRATNIKTVMKKADISLPHCLNRSIRSTRQNRCFFIARTIPRQNPRCKGPGGRAYM